MAKSRSKRGKTKQKPSSIINFIMGCIFLFIVITVISNLSKTSNNPSSDVKQTSSKQPSTSQGLSEEQRQEIWLALTQAWAQPDPQKAKDTLLKEFRVSSEQLTSIQQEGLSKNWKYFEQWEISEEESQQIFIDLYEMEYLAFKKVQEKYPDSPSQQEVYQKELFQEANDTVLGKYRIDSYQLAKIAEQGRTEQWVKLVDFEKLEPTRKSTKTPSSNPPVFSSETIYLGTSFSREVPLLPSDASKPGLDMSKPVKVRGYYRQDGTYVRTHTRSLPGQAK